MHDEYGILIRNPHSNLPPFTFAIAFSAKKQACGPEARALCKKSTGGKRITAGDPIVFPPKEAGLSGARPGAPTTESPCSWRKNGLPARSKK
jgi:hypothetical protein